MNRHPGGIPHTRQMISLSGLLPPAKILDMGAGSGESVEYLRSLGFEAEGIDLVSQSNSFAAAYILRGDFLHPPYENNYFDGILSQCAFYVSGQPADALSTAYRLLKPGGLLMLSDVCPGDTSLKILAEASGFSVYHYEDQTPGWKEYYIESIWRGTAECFRTDKKMNYEMVICKKK